MRLANNDLNIYSAFSRSCDWRLPMGMRSKPESTSATTIVQVQRPSGACESIQAMTVGSGRSCMTSEITLVSSRIIIQRWESGGAICGAAESQAPRRQGARRDCGLLYQGPL